MKQFLILILSSLSINLFATQFIPIEINRQLDESDAVVVGKFIGSYSKVLPSQMVVTVNSFSLQEIAGIPVSEIPNVNNFEVYTPGGLWNGKRVSVSGVPHFKQGEESVLLLKKTLWGWTVQNFSLGKYSIVRKHGRRYLQSVIFPQHKLLGSIPWNYFHALVFESLKAELVPISSRVKNVVVNRQEHNNSRGPASITSTEEKEDKENSWGLIWLALVMALLGGGMTWLNSFAYDDDN
jgi:hypothetical protein